MPRKSRAINSAISAPARGLTHFARPLLMWPLIFDRVGQVCPSRALTALPLPLPTLQLPFNGLANEIDPLLLLA